MPFFSIIIPIYNVGKYIKRCLDSVVSQTFSDYEVILVDDGSTDDSSIICDEYSKKYDNILVFHKENGGLVSARQAGAKIAKGKYIICVDGDDWVSEVLLETLYDCIKKSNADIICYGYFNYINCQNNPYEWKYEEGLYTKKKIIEKIFPNLIYSSDGKTFPCAIWAKAFKNGLYVDEQLELNPSIRIGEDAACVIPCIHNADSLYIIYDCLYYYRHNGDSMTKNRKPFRWDGPRLIAEHIKNRIDVSEYDFENQLYIRTIHSLFNVVKSQFYKDDTYFSIVKDIRNNLNEPIYEESVKCGHYKKFGLTSFMKYSLRYRLFILIWAFSKLK